MYIPEFHLVPRWWRFGLPSPIWIRNLDVIRRIIEKNKVQPFADTFLDAQQAQFEQLQGMATHGLQQEQFAQPAAAHAPAEAPVKRKLPGGVRPYPFPGGLKIAHVHLDDRVYPLERAQWQEF